MTDPAIRITTTPRYMAGQSKPEENRYAFAYHITIHNQSDEPVQLISRHWLIVDGNEQKQEVRGEGVVGEQPRIEPGHHYSYTSGALLETPVGTMEGSYLFRRDDGTEFDAPIAPFLLAAPGAVN